MLIQMMVNKMHINWHKPYKLHLSSLHMPAFHKSAFYVNMYVYCYCFLVNLYKNTQLMLSKYCIHCMLNKNTFI